MTLTTSATTEVNPQEIKNVVVMTERLIQLKKEWEDADPAVYVDDTLLFTKSWQETDGLPLDLRWAKAFAKRMEESPILLRDNELIVGSLTKFIRGNNVLVAMKPREVLEMAEKGRFDRKLSDTSATYIDPTDLKLLTEDARYWVEHMPQVNYVNEALKEELGEEHFDLMFDRGMVFEGRAVRHSPDRGLFQGWGAFGGGIAQPNMRVIHNGLNHVIALAKSEMDKMVDAGARLPGASSAALRKYYLLKATIVSCEAIITYAHRYAELARSQARDEKNPVRKLELEKIAEVCDWVPANPPRNYWEAVQSLRFLHLACWKESSERPEVPIGRLDQILYPFYEQDMVEGRLTRQDAAELLGAFWLKIRETENLVTIKREHRAAPGTLLPNVTLCGVDDKGCDLTNEVSWLVLEVMRQIKLSEPAVYIRYHDGMDKRFVLHALECNRDFGGGNPAFLNDELGTARYLARGVKPEDAVGWNASGCLGYHLDCAEHMAGMFSINQAKIFELTMHNGYDPRTGKQLGLETGDVTKFNSIEQFYEAFFKQEDHFAEILRKHYFIWWSSENMNSPMSGLRVAMLYEDCIPAGMASREGGARYAVCRSSWIGDRGITDVADAISSIKHLVFDTKKLSISDLLEAMKENWEGHEDMRQMCLNAPKYGNDNDFVDDIFNRVSLTTQEILTARPDPFTGEKPLLFKGAAAGHVTQGASVGALPNGRKAGSPVNDAGTSAMPGMDVFGPTALINSATKANHAWDTVGITHNMKFSKSMLSTPEKLEKLASLIKTFMARGGWHIQFNIHSSGELLEAKKHPEQYKNVLVRVGGYSAYFVDLPPELQDEIIARTLHEVS